MSTLESTLESASAQSADADAETGVPSYAGVLTTSDHKVIGQLLIGWSLLGLVIAGALGALLGAERIDGDETLLDQNALAQLFGGFRVGLVQVALLPLMLGICVLAVPLQLGARSLAFPRAAAAGFWAWLGGAVLLVIALTNNGGPSGGNRKMVQLYLASNALMLIGLTAVAATVATSVLTTRAPGMRMHRVPLFSWSALVASLGLVLVLPVAVGVNVLLYVDYRYTASAFGGSRGILDWTSFVITGPVLALFALPAIGFLAELLPVTFRRRLPFRGVMLAGLALVGSAAFAGIAQRDVVTLAWSGSGLSLDGFGTKIADLITYGLLALLPILGVFIVLGLGALVAKPRKVAGETVRPNLIAPFMFAAFGAGLIVLGMFGAVINGIEDLALGGTVYEEGATVALVYGAVLAGLGAVSYWFPKLAGPRLPDRPLYGLATLGALAAALASIPLFLAGFAKQPAAAAIYDNDGPGALWNLAATAGHALMVVVVLAFAGLAVSVARKSTGGESDHGDDPWGGHTLEWSTSSPAPVDNFAVTPTVMSPEPLLDLKAAPDFAAAAPGGDR